MTYKPQAVLSLSNFGGISIMIDPEDNDYLYYQYYDEDPVRTEIYYIDDTENQNAEEEELIPVFNMEEDNVFRINEFMILDY